MQLQAVEDEIKRKATVPVLANISDRLEMMRGSLYALEMCLTHAQETGGLTDFGLERSIFACMGLDAALVDCIGLVDSLEPVPACGA